LDGTSKTSFSRVIFARSDIGSFKNEVESIACQPIWVEIITAYTG
jgi:hypothetical protein